MLHLSSPSPRKSVWKEMNRVSRGIARASRRLQSCLLDKGGHGQRFPTTPQAGLAKEEGSELAGRLKGERAEGKGGSAPLMAGAAYPHLQAKGFARGAATLGSQNTNQGTVDAKAGWPATINCLNVNVQPARADSPRPLELRQSLRSPGESILFPADGAWTWRPGLHGRDSRRPSACAFALAAAADNGALTTGGAATPPVPVVDWRQWRLETMREVLQLEQELLETLKRVHSVRARCARLRDALQRLEASAARAHTGGRGPVWTPVGLSGGALEEIEDGALAKPDAGARVLRGLEKSEARLAVLQQLAATLSQQISRKEESIVQSFLEERNEQARQLREQRRQSVRGGSRTRYGVARTRQAARLPGAYGRVGVSQGWQPAAQQPYPGDGSEDEAALGIDGALSVSTAAETHEQRESSRLRVEGLSSDTAEGKRRAGERRRVVLAMYQQEVQELLQEVSAKVQLLQILEQTVDPTAPRHEGSSEGGGIPERLQEAQGLQQQLEGLLSSIHDRILSTDLDN